MILDTLVVPEYSTRDAVMSNTKIMFSPDTGAASRAEIFLTAPNIILSGLSLAASILTICRPGLRPVLIKQIICCPTRSLARNTLSALSLVSFNCPTGRVGSVHKCSNTIVTSSGGLSSYREESFLCCPGVPGDPRTGLEENLDWILVRRVGLWSPPCLSPVLIMLAIVDIGEWVRDWDLEWFGVTATKENKIIIGRRKGTPIT